MTQLPERSMARPASGGRVRRRRRQHVEAPVELLSRAARELDELAARYLDEEAELSRRVGELAARYLDEEAELSRRVGELLFHPGQAETGRELVERSVLCHNRAEHLRLMVWEMAYLVEQAGERERRRAAAWWRRLAAWWRRGWEALGG